nr:NlG14 [Nilaparvata lugens]
MLLRKIVFGLLIMLSTEFLVRGDETDTTLFDFVANGLLEDSVDVMEIVAWFSRRVKDNMSQQLDAAFNTLSKQQNRIDPLIEHAGKLNRSECTNEKLFQITDIIFREYFNLNANCIKISKKMSVFLIEMQNATSSVIEIQRRYMNSAPTCEPPYKPTVDRECLQDLVNKGRKEIFNVRKGLLTLGYDIEDFMDNHAEETFACLLPAMSQVRTATKRAANEIQCCLAGKKECSDFDEKTFRFPYERQVYIELPTITTQFDDINFSKEDPALARKEFLEQKRLQQPYPQFGIPPPGTKPPLKPKTPSRDASDFQDMMDQRKYEEMHPPWRMQPNNEHKYDLIKDKRQRGTEAQRGGAFDNFDFNDDYDSADDDDFNDASFADFIAELRQLGQQIEAEKKMKEQNNEKDEL